MATDHFPACVHLFALNVALASLTVATIALAIGLFLRRSSLPLQYAALCVPVVFMLACPLPLWFGTSLELGFMGVSLDGQSASGVNGADSDVLSDPTFDERLVDLPATAEDEVLAAARSMADSSVDPGDDHALLADSGRQPPADGLKGTARSRPMGHTQQRGWIAKLGIFFGLVWIAIASLFAARLIIGLAIIHRLRSTAKPLTDARTALAANEACREFKRSVAVLQSERIASPMAIGFRRPVILLPAGIANVLTGEQLACTLSHELAHVVRRDTLVALLQHLATVLFWWNPLLHLLNRRINRLREHICDDYVAAVLGQGRSLAEAIVAIAEWSSNRKNPTWLAHTLFDGCEELAARISRLVHHRRAAATTMNGHAWRVVLGIAVALSGSILVPALRAQVRAPSPPANGTTAKLLVAEPGQAADNAQTPADDVPPDPLPKRAVLRLGDLRFRHSHPVDSLAFSPDGRYLASGSFDKSVRIWEAESGRLIRTLADSAGRSNCGLAFSPDGATLATVSLEGRVAAWDYRTGKNLWEEPHADQHGSVVFFPDSSRIAVAGASGMVSVRDAASGKLLFSLTPPGGEAADKGWGQAGRPTALAISPDGLQMAFGWKRNIYTASVEDPTQIGEIPNVHGSAILSLEFTPDGKQLLSCGNSELQTVVLEGKSYRTYYPELCLWNVQDHSLAQTYTTKEKKTGSTFVRLSPDGRRLYTVQSEVIRTWNTKSGAQVAEPVACRNLRIPSNNALAVSPDGRRLAGSGSQHQIAIWDLQTGVQQFGDEKTNAGAVQVVAYSSGGQVLAAAGMNGQFNLWDRQSGSLLHSLRLPIDPAAGMITINSLSFSPDGNQIAVASTSGDAREPRAMLTVWDVKEGTQVGTRLADERGRIAGYQWLPESWVLSTAVPSWALGGKKSSGDSLIYMDSDGMRHEVGPEGLPGVVVGCSIDSEAQTVRYVGEQMNLYAWDIGTGSVTKHPLTAARGTIRDAVFSADGKTLATSGLFDSNIYLWDTANGRETRRIGYEGTIGSHVALSPDGSWLAAAPVEIAMTTKQVPKNIQIWATRTGEKGIELELPGAHALSLTFSPNGQELLTGHLDGTLLIWDLQ